MADQQAKRAAATAYDYDADPRWADYWSNVLVPSHLAARPEVLRHFKMKFYQRYVDPELPVEPLSSVSSPRPSPSPAAPRRRASATGDRVNSSNANAREPSAQPTPSSWRLDQESVLFLANAWVTVMSILALIPILPYALGEKTYRLTLIGSGLTCLYTIWKQHGVPRGFNLQSLQTWLQSVFNQNDFLYLMYSFVFVSASIPIKVAVVPLACRSLEQVVTYLRRNFSSTQLYKKYLDKPSSWVVANSNLLKTLSASSEIGVGFLLIMLLITPQRNVIQAFVHWQLLKLMYHIPTTAPYHRNTWSTIGCRASPYLQRFPVLQSPVGYVQRWFNA